MPPAVLVLGLIAVGVPAGLYALFGRPRGLVRAWVLAAAGAASAQALGELLGFSFGVLGDAQLVLATLAAVAAAGIAAVAEGPAKR